MTSAAACHQLLFEQEDVVINEGHKQHDLMVGRSRHARS
jgi:hypothetical protein